MQSKNFYSKLFFIGALWNFIISGCLLLIIAVQIDLWDLFGIEKPESYIWLIGFLIFVGCIGIGNYAVSKNLNDNHAAITLEVVAKICVFILFTYYFSVQEVGIMVFLLGCGDLIWAIFFIEFLVHYQKEK